MSIPWTKCQECGGNAYRREIDTWLVADDIWKAAGCKSTDVLCKRCFVTRLRSKFGLKSRGFLAVLTEYRRKR